MSRTRVRPGRRTGARGGARIGGRALPLVRRGTGGARPAGCRGPDRRPRAPGARVPEDRSAHPLPRSRRPCRRSHLGPGRARGRRAVARGGGVARPALPRARGRRCPARHRGGGRRRGRPASARRHRPGGRAPGARGSPPPDERSLRGGSRALPVGGGCAASGRHRGRRRNGDPRPGGKAIRRLTRRRASWGERQQHRGVPRERPPAVVRGVVRAAKSVRASRSGGPRARGARGSERDAHRSRWNRRARPGGPRLEARSARGERE